MMNTQNKSGISKIKTILMLLLVALVSIGATLYITKPDKLLHFVGDVIQNSYDPSFLPPSEFTPQRIAYKGVRMKDVELPSISNIVTAGAQYPQISGDEIHQYLSELTEFSQQSKRDGDLLWGRISGSKHEYDATKYVAKHFRDWGLQDVTMDRSVVTVPVWQPSVIDLTVKGTGETPDISLKSAMTGRVSAVTTAEGITAPLVYVGMGSRAELRGKDIKGKIALLYTRVWEGALLHSGHLPALRLVKEYGAAGVILWLDLPGNNKYASVLYTASQLGESPWVNIGFEDGLYLRKRIEHADIDNPPMMNLKVIGQTRDDLTSQNLFAQLPGNSDETIMITAHIDGYFNAALDNGTGVSALMTLAHHYSQIPQSERPYNLLFLITGEHEADGKAGMVKFVKKHPELIDKTKLVIQLEHMASPGISKEINLLGLTNTENARLMMVTNVSPWLVKNMTQAANDYGIVMVQNVFQEYAGDIKGLIDTGIPTIGWIETGYFYHNEADSPDMISAAALQNMTRAYATIIDRLGVEGIAQVSKDGLAPPTGTMHSAKDMMFFFSQW